MLPSLSKRGAAERLVSLLISFAVLAWAATPIHEGFHYLAAKTIGYEWQIHLTWLGSGWLEPALNGGPSELEWLLIRLAGGMGTAAVFGLLWFVTARQVRYTKWELDDTVALCFLTFGEFLYGIHETTWLGSNYGFPWIVAGLLTIAIYGRHWRWFLGESYD